jgi:hypothetical protein
MQMISIKKAPTKGLALPLGYDHSERKNPIVIDIMCSCSLKYLQLLCLFISVGSAKYVTSSPLDEKLSFLYSVLDRSVRAHSKTGYLPDSSELKYVHSRQNTFMATPFY